MKHIDENLVDAFKRMRLAFITNRKVADKLGISAKHVGKIIAGEVQALHDDTWARIGPLVAPYLKPAKPTIPAPEGVKRTFVATHLHVLTDEQIDQIALMIIEAGGAL